MNIVNDEVKRLLVDPTFVQFIDDNNKLSDLKLYADRNCEDNILVLDLLTYGVSEIDSVDFNKYLNYFNYDNQYFELEEYLFQKRINGNSSISFNEKGLS